MERKEENLILLGILVAYAALRIIEARLIWERQENYRLTGELFDVATELDRLRAKQKSPGKGKAK